VSLDIIIVNYQTPGDLERCLNSLVEFPPTVDHQVVVVNNDPLPLDHDVATLYVEGRPNWVMVPLDNEGYANACNFVAGSSSTDVLAFFNADVEFTYNVLDACHDALLANDRWGILGPRQVNRSGEITHAGIFGTHDHPQLRGWKRRTSDYQDVRDDAISVSGSAYFVKRKCWDELAHCPTYQASIPPEAPKALGAFLPTPHYYEETWCSYHAWAHRWKVVYWGLHTMVHEWHTASPVGGAADRLMPKSREMFRHACRQHGIPHD